jgi:hypothetical protein
MRFLHGCVRTFHPTALALAGLLVTSPQPTNAQIGSYWTAEGSARANILRVRSRAPFSSPGRQSASEQARQKRKRADGAGEKEKAPIGPLFAILSLSDQHISVYNSGGLVTRFRVSTGMPGHRTPMGVFSIIGRERWHRSNIYSGAPMPYMQRITWSGVALHLGVVPGYPASHGCIRLPAGSAERLWGMTKIGERVVISPHEITPSEIAHPSLPLPKLQPAPVQVTENTPLRTTDVATAGIAALPVGAPRMLNPIEYAQALKTRALADAAFSAKAVKEHAERAHARAEEARAAATLRRAVEAGRAQAAAKLAASAKALEAAKSPAARENAEAAKTAAEAQLLEATNKLNEASTGEAAKSGEAADAERLLKEARTALGNAQAAAKEADRRASPVSILVSKKDHRVYIRQALAPVLDAPVSIRDADTPLGTHTYIAVGSPTDGSALRWSVVSLPSSPTSSTRQAKETRDKHAQPQQIPASSAAEALQRVELSKEVSERISELLWTGGSLIISDQPLSDETGDLGTDIVVKTR